MENGSTPPDAKAAANGSSAANGNGSLPLPARLLGVGVRGARSVGKATGLDRAVEIAAEEAIVAAVESEAVERALARVLQGPAVEDAVQDALESDAVKRAVLEAMDSELVDEVWKRLLASDQAQQLVERIAEAPEVRAAISAQGVGLLEDIGRTIGKLARRLDNSFERIVRRVFFRRPRPLPTDHAGAVSRSLAMAIDGVIVNLAFSALAALAALIVSAFTGNGSGVSDLALVAGASAWVGFGSLYLVAFWSLAGQTPGMRFLGVRIGQGRLPLRRSIGRLAGLYLAVITFGLGFLGIVFGERRRGLPDRFGRTDVVYDEQRPEPAPWSRLEPDSGESASADGEAEPVGEAGEPAAAVPSPS